MLFDALAEAIAELPVEQRDVFVAHELEGRSFKEMSAATGVSVNTLLSREWRAAAARALRTIYDDITKHEDLHMNFKRFMKWPFIVPTLIVVGPVIAAIVVFVFGGIVMLLWNWLLPRLFGFPRSRCCRDSVSGALPDAVWRFGGGGGGTIIPNMTPGGARAIARPAVQHDSGQDGAVIDSSSSTPKNPQGMGGGVDGCGVSCGEAA